MFQTKWFRAVMVLAVLASLLVAPIMVSAQDAAMTNGITAPAEDATLSGTVDITGYANDADFDKWDLFLFPGGDDSLKTWVASGTDAGEFTVSLDTTKYLDGAYTLALRIVRATDGNYSEVLVPVTFANAAAAPVEEEAAPVVTETAATTETVAAPAEEVAAPAEETAAPVNGFDAEDGIEVSGTVTVTGYADTANFDKWQLDVLPLGVADDAIFAAIGEEAGEFSYALDTTQFPDGDHQLRLRVVNTTGNYDEYFVDVTVANGEAEPAAVAATPAVTETAATTETVAAPAEEVAAPVEEETAAMTNGITAPAKDATLSGTVDITGYANDADFDKWDLFLFPGGDDSLKTWVASGTDAGEFTVSLDTAKYLDGAYTLALRIVRATDGNYSEVLVPVTFANAAE